MSAPAITRIWAMPNRWTFCIQPIRELLARYVHSEQIWIDPCCGKYSPATVRNDLNTECEADSHLDAIEFLNKYDADSIDGVLFDPPYSPSKGKECYKGYYPSSKSWWASC